MITLYGIIVLKFVYLLIVATCVSGYFYATSPGHNINRKKTISGKKVEGFNRQDYVSEHLDVYGVNDKEKNVDNKQIHLYKYNQFGL